MSRRMGVRNFQLHLQDVSYVALWVCSVQQLSFSWDMSKMGQWDGFYSEVRTHQTIADFGLTVFL